MRFFVDTNILIYTRDRRTPEKRETARTWLREIADREMATINMQTLNELCHVILRKFPAARPAELRAWTNELRAWGDTVVDQSIVEDAWSIRADYGYSWFDCVLLSAAAKLDCTHFLSEDLSPERKVRGMAIVNPMTTPPNALLKD